MVLFQDISLRLTIINVCFASHRIQKVYVVDPQALQNLAATSGNFLVFPHACLASINAFIAGDVPNDNVVYMKECRTFSPSISPLHSRCLIQAGDVT